MKLKVSGICSILAVLSLCSLGTMKAEEKKDSTVLPYLVQEVCVDQKGVVQSVDPYFCPKEDSLRQLQIGEPLPYHKHYPVDPHSAAAPKPGDDKDPEYNFHDSFPVRALDGTVLSVDSFGFGPDKSNASLDGYDTYRIDDGWASVEETRDNGAFSVTWFGASCKPYKGWVFFPLADLTPSGIKAGQVKMPISGVYWEKDGEHWPGDCPSTSQASPTQATQAASAQPTPEPVLCHPGSHCPSKNFNEPLTTWEFMPNYPFAGIGNNPVKRLDTIRSIHGFIDSPEFRERGDMEVFYFTKLYGSTRWEDWVPLQAVEANPRYKRLAERASMYCHGTDDVEYQGVKFVVVACRDWTQISVPDKPEFPNPRPIPDLNLLQNFHFDQGLANWQRTGSGHDLQWSLKVSTEARDLLNLQHGGVGVRSLSLTCTANCSAANAMYQDVPVTGKTTSGRYSLGARVRAEGNAGSLRIAVAMLDRKGKVLGEKSFVQLVPLPGGASANSVVLSGSFVLKTFAITIDPKASVLRFSISPTTSGNFNIVDTWLMKNTY